MFLKNLSSEEAPKFAQKSHKKTVRKRERIIIRDDPPGL